MTTAITGARVFDGHDVRPTTTVVLEGRRIVGVGGGVPDGAEVVDARGGTPLPGLIDAHVHTNASFLGTALRFGVTTELEMGGFSTRAERDAWGERDDLADVRSAGWPVTAPQGHPTQLFADPATRHPGSPSAEDFPQTSTADDARLLVSRIATAGSDYVKFILEDGTVFGRPGMPELGTDAFAAGVAAAHDAGLLAVTHAQTCVTAERAVRAGTDGLAHLFFDRPDTGPLVVLVQASGTFVTPCLVLVSSMLGRTAEDLAADPRVESRLDEVWLQALRRSRSTYPGGDFAAALATVKALSDAGVDVLAGTDVAAPEPGVGGLAHGASLHHELQLLVLAGLSPVQALRAATSVPARRFGLADRGRVAEGLRADLLLVDGDPTETVSDTLSVRAVWRRGVRADLG